ncbi:MAG: lysophospholipid acyltransferase family protein [Acidimicrobiales bacterium]|jgi:1-acyl-sn-glycerol-3-phosphate acyltransferase|nr:lysophospholipid acyltransferase family protein [Acidimicrobiales bacterium]MDP6286752.1 lysophospholipid acyltransferase family protein [Acidimicrobiales bacterium]MDP6910808.1 lysophospholipid acyltransferase family protein [Acidimicrobiales bacterium]HJM72621.1 lysophospholipid acyltransferase family protein [Acidimicrobiales bacterium]
MAGGLGFPWRAAPVPTGIEPPSPDHGLGADYDTGWARRYPARVARAAILESVMRPAMAVLASPARRGLDRLDCLDGSVVFVANHHSHADTPLLLTSIPEPWRHRIVVGAAADYFFSNRMSGAVSALAIGAVPIERSKVGRKSADMARGLIDDGWSILLYPEGGRSPDGWGQEFRGGAAYLAIRCGVPVVPIHLQGTGRILRKGRTLPRPSRTTVTFGDPLTADHDESARAFAVRLQAAVAALGDEATSDWYQARIRAHAGTSPGLTGPDVGAWRRAWALGDRDRSSQRRRRRWPAL